MKTVRSPFISSGNVLTGGDEWLPSRSVLHPVKRRLFSEYRSRKHKRSADNMARHFGRSAEDRDSSVVHVTSFANASPHQRRRKAL